VLIWTVNQTYRDNEINILCTERYEVIEQVSVRSSETSANFYQPTVLVIVPQSAALRTELKEGTVELKQFHIVSRMPVML
jgi:hypothetical protein